MKKFRLPILIGLFAICCTVTVARILRTRWLNEPLASHAKDFTASMDRTDSNGLLKYCFPEEKSLCQLDASKMNYLLRLYQDSLPKGLSWSKWEFTKSDSDQAFVLDHIATLEGSKQRYAVTFTLYRTDSGISTFLVSSLVFAYTRNIGLSDLDHLPERDRIMVANVRGLKKIKDDLIAHGILGTVNERTLDGMTTWDNWITFWSRLLQKMGIEVP